MSKQRKRRDVLDILCDDEVLPLTELIKHLPKAARPHPATLWRWHRRGCLTPNGKRVHLKTARVGKVIVSTPAALTDFLTAIQD